MSLDRAQVLERLAAEQPCLGAVFFSYGFDPAFFEDHVLRAVLRLNSDPLEQPVRYHDEAVRALQDTPVAVFVDASERQAGRRLPYDVLGVRRSVFHPKLALLVYETFARVHIGSGNLTFGGYGTNDELFVTLDLHYEEPREAATLSDLLESVDRLTRLAKAAGSQFGFVREELQRRIPEAPSPGRDQPQLLWVDSMQGSILDQVIAAVPKDAVIQRIGVMAPFYERDDATAADSMESVFGRLLELAGPDAGLDVGVLWENPPIHAVAHDLKIDDRLGALWAWRAVGEETKEAFIEYLVPTRVARTRLHYADEHGEAQSWPLAEVNEALDDQRLWPVESPLVFAPAAALASAKARFGEMQLWLHPSTRLVDGRPQQRPLHAKLLTIQYTVGGIAETVVVVGSANASRKALLHSVEQGGNAELCLVMRVRRPLRLPDIADGLVAYDRTKTQIQEREFPELSRNFGLAIETATYDPSSRTLTVEWASSATLPAWTLRYRDASIAEGIGLPAEPIVVPDFDLHRATAELTLVVGADGYSVPILVTDLAKLPVGPGEGLLGLQDLLLLLGRRVGHERLTMLAEQRAAAGASDDGLEEAFGAGFGPTDVFKAWWSAAEEIAAPETSVAAVRRQLEGALGLGAVWSRMLEEAEKGSPYSPEMIWFYGAELHRELGTLRFPDDPIGAKKAALVDTFRSGLKKSLSGLMSPETTQPWMQHVRTFYGVSQ